MYKYKVFDKHTGKNLIISTKKEMQPEAIREKFQKFKQTDAYVKFSEQPQQPQQPQTLDQAAQDSLSNYQGTSLGNFAQGIQSERGNREELARLAEGAGLGASGLAAFLPGGVVTSPAIYGGSQYVAEKIRGNKDAGKTALITAGKDAVIGGALSGTMKGLKMAGKGLHTGVKKYHPELAEKLTNVPKDIWDKAYKTKAWQTTKENVIDPAKDVFNEVAEAARRVNAPERLVKSSKKIDLDNAANKESYQKDILNTEELAGKSLGPVIDSKNAGKQLAGTMTRAKKHYQKDSDLVKKATEKMGPIQKDLEGFISKFKKEAGEELESNAYKFSPKEQKSLDEFYDNFLKKEESFSKAKIPVQVNGKSHDFLGRPHTREGFKRTYKDVGLEKIDSMYAQVSKMKAEVKALRADNVTPKYPAQVQKKLKKDLKVLEGYIKEKAPKYAKLKSGQRATIRLQEFFGSAQTGVKADSKKLGKEISKIDSKDDPLFKLLAEGYAAEPKRYSAYSPEKLNKIIETNKLRSALKDRPKKVAENYVNQKSTLAESKKVESLMKKDKNLEDLVTKLKKPPKEKINKIKDKDKSQIDSLLKKTSTFDGDTDLARQLKETLGNKDFKRLRTVAESGKSVENVDSTKKLLEAKINGKMTEAQKDTYQNLIKEFPGLRKAVKRVEALQIKMQTGKLSSINLGDLSSKKGLAIGGAATAASMTGGAPLVGALALAQSPKVHQSVIRLTKKTAEIAKNLSKNKGVKKAVKAAPYVTSKLFIKNNKENEN